VPNRAEPGSPLRFSQTIDLKPIEVGQRRIGVIPNRRWAEFSTDRVILPWSKLPTCGCPHLASELRDWKPWQVVVLDGYDGEQLIRRRETATDGSQEATIQKMMCDPLIRYVMVRDASESNGKLNGKGRVDG
jgi:hypothetical protein